MTFFGFIKYFYCIYGWQLAFLATRLPVVAHLPAPRPLPTLALHKRTNSDTVGVRLALRATQVSALAFVLLPCGCQPTHRFLAKDEDSRWRALRRRGDPGTDIPDSLPRTTRVGGLLRGTPPYLTPIPNPSAAFPTGLDRRSPVSRPVLGGRVKRKVRALCVLFYCTYILWHGACVGCSSSVPT